MKVGISMAACSAAAVIVAASGLAMAQEQVEVEVEQRAPMRASVFSPDAYQPNRPNLSTPFGMGATVGGGVVGFTGDVATDYTSVGGTWNARLTLGTRTMLAAEAAYVGSAQAVDAVGIDDSATLIGNGGEIAARLNLLPGAFQPYIYGGVGHIWYTLTNEGVNTSNVDNTDQTLYFPVGGGLAFRHRGLLVDARGTFRPTANGDMFTNGGNNMHTWSANLNAGIEF